VEPVGACELAGRPQTTSSKLADKIPAAILFILSPMSGTRKLEIRTLCRPWS